MAGVQLGDNSVALGIDSVETIYDCPVEVKDSISGERRFKERIVGCIHADDAPVQGISNGITAAEGRSEGY